MKFDITRDQTELLAYSINNLEWNLVAAIFHLFGLGAFHASMAVGIVGCSIHSLVLAHHLVVLQINRYFAQYHIPFRFDIGCRYDSG